MARIFSNRPRGTITLAIWEVMDRLWRTIFAPIRPTAHLRMAWKRCDEARLVPLSAPWFQNIPAQVGYVIVANWPDTLIRPGAPN